MFGSKSSYFHKSIPELRVCRYDVKLYLELKGYDREQIAVYIRAFDYFILEPNDFDGATLVNDLCDIPYLDIDAMLHDYHYIYCGVASSISFKWKADKLYAKGNERKGKSLYAAYSRFIGLSLSGIGFILFARLKRGRMTKEQKEKFLQDYNILNC